MHDRSEQYVWALFPWQPSWRHGSVLVWCVFVYYWVYCTQFSCLWVFFFLVLFVPFGWRLAANWLGCRLWALNDQVWLGCSCLSTRNHSAFSHHHSSVVWEQAMYITATDISHGHESLWQIFLTCLSIGSFPIGSIRDKFVTPLNFINKTSQVSFLYFTSLTSFTVGGMMSRSLSSHLDGWYFRHGRERFDACLHSTVF